MTDIIDNREAEGAQLTEKAPNQVALCALEEIFHGLDLFRGLSVGTAEASELKLAQINGLCSKANAWRDLEIAMEKCGLGDTECGLVASVTCSALGIMSVTLTAGQRHWDIDDIKDVYIQLSQLTHDLGTASYDTLYTRARIMRLLETVSTGLLPSRHTGVTRFMN